MKAYALKIFCAEDDSVGIDLLRAGLSEVFPLHNLTLVQHADEVLPNVKEQMPDLIFLNHTLAGGDEHECLQLLKNDFQTQAIPVIIYSRSSTASVIQRCYELGAVRYFLKSSDYRDISPGLKLIFDLHYNGLLSRPHISEFVIGNRERCRSKTALISE